MLQARSMCALALLGLLAGAAAQADDRNGYRNYGSGNYYQSGPQVRLGVDVIWGGYSYGGPRPPVVWYPAYSYQPYPVYVPRYAPGYEQARGKGYWKRHRHRH